MNATKNYSQEVLNAYSKLTSLDYTSTTIDDFNEIFDFSKAESPYAEYGKANIEYCNNEEKYINNYFLGKKLVELGIADITEELQIFKENLEESIKDSEEEEFDPLYLDEQGYQEEKSFNEKVKAEKNRLLREIGEAHINQCKKNGGLVLKPEYFNFEKFGEDIFKENEKDYSEMHEINGVFFEKW